jgi:hypothetical protein
MNLVETEKFQIRCCPLSNSQQTPGQALGLWRFIILFAFSHITWDYGVVIVFYLKIRLVPGLEPGPACCLLEYVRGRIHSHSFVMNTITHVL